MIKTENNTNGASCSRVVALALNGGSKSKHIVRCALDTFGADGSVSFKIIHVFSRISGVPTPMGNLIPLAQVRDDVVAAYKKEIEWQKNEMILPYQKSLIQNKVVAEIVLIESDEIGKAISNEIAKCGIKDLVIGASSNSLFARKFRGQSLCSLILESAPSFCTINVVSKGKLQALRPSDKDQTQTYSVEYDCSTPVSNFTSSRFSNSSLEFDSACSESSYASFPGLVKRLDLGPTLPSRFKPPSGKEVNAQSAVNLRNSGENESCFSDRTSSSRYYSVSSIEQQQKDINAEVEKLKIELRHIREMYSITMTEAKDTTSKLSDLNRLQHEEGMKLEQIKEKQEIAKVLARLEKERFEAAKREAEHARECALKNASQRRESVVKGAQSATEKLEPKSTPTPPVYQYQIFTWEEIVSATASFNERLKIGEGSYGTVYKGKLHRTPVVIKVLHSKEEAKSEKFLQQIGICHPHLLSFLGACPEQGCLVYEYMENGSLEDRLFRRNDTAPLPWYERFRIVREVASTVSFLHNNRPNPIIHGSLNPANILLDRNLVSKISITPKTLCNDRNSVNTDINALGIVILQLLTGQADAGITQIVEGAIKERRLMSVLDKDAGRWPFRETGELALLGVQCAELRHRDKHDLQDNVLPVLNRIKDVAEKASDFAAAALVTPPSHFICPILMAVMEDPCVASDGYTYDRKAIELWVKDNDTSPTTNFPLANKHLIPNHSLLYAITEWKSKRKLRTEKPRIYASFSWTS